MIKWFPWSHGIPLQTQRSYHGYPAENLIRHRDGHVLLLDCPWNKPSSDKGLPPWYFKGSSTYPTISWAEDQGLRKIPSACRSVSVSHWYSARFVAYTSTFQGHRRPSLLSHSSDWLGIKGTRCGQRVFNDVQCLVDEIRFIACFCSNSFHTWAMKISGSRIFGSSWSSQLFR